MDPIPIRSGRTFLIGSAALDEQRGWSVGRTIPEHLLEAGNRSAPISAAVAFQALVGRADDGLVARGIVRLQPQQFVDQHRKP